MNVALYGAAGKRWSMVERGQDRVYQSCERLCIGPSSISWEGDTLVLRIDEWTVPWPARIRGTVRLHPAALTGQSFALDAAGRHRWSPLAPLARVEVDLQDPLLRWSGNGYLDSNTGTAPLEHDFADWTWSRAATPAGTAILYDVNRRDGGGTALALECDKAGRVQHFTAPPVTALPRTGWRIGRSTRADAGQTAGVLQTLEDTPFYARSVVQTHLLGAAVTAVHESLSLDRFDTAWVQALLPFRMPRRRH